MCQIKQKLISHRSKKFNEHQGQDKYTPKKHIWAQYNQITKN